MYILQSRSPITFVEILPLLNPTFRVTTDTIFLLLILDRIIDLIILSERTMVASKHPRSLYRG